MGAYFSVCQFRHVWNSIQQDSNSHASCYEVTIYSASQSCINIRVRRVYDLTLERMDVS